LKLLNSADSMISYLDILTESKKLYYYKHNGIHITFNSLAEKEEAENAIRLIQNKKYY
jgi:hypothetical protein